LRDTARDVVVRRRLGIGWGFAPWRTSACTDLGRACCCRIPCSRGNFHRRGGNIHCSIAVDVRIGHCIAYRHGDDDIPWDAEEDIGHGTLHIDDVGAEGNIVDSWRRRKLDHIQRQGRKEDAPQIGAHTCLDEDTEEDEVGLDEDTEEDEVGNPTDCSGSYH